MALDSTNAPTPQRPFPSSGQGRAATGSGRELIGSAGGPEVSLYHGSRGARLLEKGSDLSKVMWPAVA